MPALSCDPNDLIAAAKCYECEIPPGNHPAIQTYILDQIRILNGGAVMTIDELQAESKCFKCLDGMQQEVQIFQLCQIANQ